MTIVWSEGQMQVFLAAVYVPMMCFAAGGVISLVIWLVKPSWKRLGYSLGALCLAAILLLSPILAHSLGFKFVMKSEAVQLNHAAPAGSSEQQSTHSEQQ